MIERVDQIFHTSVKQLEDTADLMDAAEAMQGPARQSILMQREDLVRELCETVEHLRQAVERFHAVTTRKNRSNLARLRKELDESIRVAREVERRTEQLTEAPTYDPKDFE